MFTMPNKTVDPELTEGGSDDKPIRLEQLFTIEKLDHLLTWFYQ